MNRGNWLGAYSQAKVNKLRDMFVDIEQHARLGLKYEKLDQLTTELFLGVR